MREKRWIDRTGEDDDGDEREWEGAVEVPPMGLQNNTLIGEQ